MGYVAGETILDDEYIAFVNSSSSPFGINHIMGTGSGNQGLGQSTIGVVNAGDTITAAQWNALFTAMDNVANHTNTSLTSTAARAAGDPVAIVSSLVSDLASLSTAVAGGSTSASGGLTAGGEDSSRVASAVYDQTHIVEESFTFDGGDEARFFFNAGGKIRVSVSNNAAGSTGRDTAMNAVISALGNFDIGATTSTRSGSGELIVTNGLAKGYFDLGTSYTTLLKLADDEGTYTSQTIFIQIEAKADGEHSDARGNVGDVVTVKVTCSVNDGSSVTDYHPQNLDSRPVEDESVGTTDVSFRTVDPNTSEGLNPVYTNVAVANVSNTTNDSGS
tara:strand:+ start:84 stop:1082 length:999 start_codon:yes stop_codon:yes gene_type:complete